MGYREVKQRLLESRFTLRSQLPELVIQELWGVLLAYNLIRYKMVLMAKSLPSLHPNQLSFRDASSYIIFKLTQLSSQTPGSAPRGGNSSLMGAYPRALKMNKNKYSINAEGGFYWPSSVDQSLKILTQLRPETLAW